MLSARGRTEARGNVAAGRREVRLPPSILVFRLDDRRYGFWLTTVERVIRMVELTPLPRAPWIVAGVIDLAGTPVAAVDLRRRLRLPPRTPTVSDQIVIVRTGRFRIAAVVDFAEGIRQVPEFGVVEPGEILPGRDCVEGIVRLDDGLVLLHDIEGFLSETESRQLQRALEGRD